MVKQMIELDELNFKNFIKLRSNIILLNIFSFKSSAIKNMICLNILLFKHFIEQYKIKKYIYF